MWAVIEEEREGLAATFDAVPEGAWDTPSLCGHWTVRQVLGHVVVASKPPMGRFMLEMVKARGSFDTANDRLALASAARPVDELRAAFRANASARFTPPGLGPEAPLHDVLLHSLDVRIPLGVPTARPAERYAPALELALSKKGERTLAPKGRPAVRWVATDLPWEQGEGPEVHGTMADLTLIASGRPARLDELTGDGVPALATWRSR